MTRPIDDHRDDGQCHQECWDKATAEHDEAMFDRMAYLDLADEFDAHGVEPQPFVESDWDPEYVEGAKRFAATRSIPLPWEIRSIDEALRLVSGTAR